MSSGADRWVVVGAGVHGTYLAAELRRAGVGPVTLVDPEEPLSRFERRCRACGMETLRSPFVQHFGEDPFSLESFAEATAREAELVDHPAMPTRPTVDLFFDHAATVVERHDLDRRRVPERAVGVSERSDDRLTVHTTGPDLPADRVVLAVGHGGRLAVPGWAAALPDGAVDHAWRAGETAAPPSAAGRIAVVGGGITGVTHALALADAGQAVTLYSRGPVEVARTEADPTWMNWRYIERRLHSLPPGSPDRAARVRDARNDGTVPPPLHERFAAAVEAGRLDHRPHAVTDADAAGDEVRLRLADGDTARADAVRLATGFDDATAAPLVDAVASDLGLATGADGYPVLDDATLAWTRIDGGRSSVCVTGALAATTVGPFAHNVVGARRAAERIRQRAARSAESPDAATAPT